MYHLEELFSHIFKLEKIQTEIEQKRVSYCNDMDSKIFAAKAKANEDLKKNEDELSAEANKISDNYFEHNSKIDDILLRLKKSNNTCIKRSRRYVAPTVGIEPDFKKMEKIRFLTGVCSPWWITTANIISLGYLKKFLNDKFFTHVDQGILWCNQRKNDLTNAYELEIDRNRSKYAKKAEEINQNLDIECLPYTLKIKSANSEATEDSKNRICNSNWLIRLRGESGFEIMEQGLCDKWGTYNSPESIASYACHGFIQVPLNFTSYTLSNLSATSNNSLFSDKGFLMPLFVPLKTNVLIEHDDDERDVVIEGIRGYISRCIRSMPLKSFEVTFIDPVGRGISLDKLIEFSFSEPHKCPLITSIPSTKSDIIARLQKLVQIVDNRSKQLAGIGSIEDYNNSHSQSFKYHIVVITDFAEGIDSSAWDYLKVLCGEAAQNAGIITVFASNRKYAPKDKLKEFYEEYKNDALFINETSQKQFECFILDRVTTVEFVGMDLVSKEFIESAKAEYIKKVVHDNSCNRFYNFESPFIFKELTLPLNLPFAIDGDTNEIVEMQLGGEFNSFAMITGTQGSGKSTTLHALITAIMTNYHPDDVELWLIDYKMTEFSTMYAGKTLPHVKYLGIENSQEFTFSILEEIKKEFESRLKLFTELGVKDLIEYLKLRKTNPELNLEKLPLIVVVIDEMSNLANHIEDSSYREGFEDILRRYRAPGLCCIFADQFPIANKRGITADTEDLIMTRLAMPHQLSHMKDTLSLPSNYYSDELLHQMNTMSAGDVIYKIKSGTSTWDSELIVKKYKSAYLTKEDIHKILDKVSTELPEEAYNTKNFKLLKGAQRQNMDIATINQYDASHPVSDGLIPLYLGTPASFDPCFRISLASKSGQNIMAISTNEDMLYSVLINSIRSFLRNSENNNVCIFAHPKNLFYKKHKGKIERFNDERLHIADDIGEICAWIRKISNFIKDREELPCNTLIITIGVEDWIEDFMYENGQSSPSSKVNFSGMAQKLNSVLEEADTLIGQANEEQNYDDDFFASLIQQIAESKDSQEEQLNEVEISQDNTTAKSSGYDASDDLYLIFKSGPRYNVFNLVISDTATGVSQARINPEQFLHKIVSVLPKDQTYALSLPYSDQMIKEEIGNTNLLYTDGICKPIRFRPYL